MTVGAQQAQILQAIIAVISIDVIQFQRDRHAAPNGQIARGALSDESSGAKQSILQPEGLYAYAVSKVFVDWSFRGKSSATPPSAANEM